MQAQCSITKRVFNFRGFSELALPLIQTLHPIFCASVEILRKIADDIEILSDEDKGMAYLGFLFALDKSGLAIWETPPQIPESMCWFDARATTLCTILEKLAPQGELSSLRSLLPALRITEATTEENVASWIDAVEDVLQGQRATTFHDANIARIQKMRRDMDAEAGKATSSKRSRMARLYDFMLSSFTPHFVPEIAEHFAQMAMRPHKYRHLQLQDLRNHILDLVPDRDIGDHTDKQDILAAVNQAIIEQVSLAHAIGAKTGAEETVAAITKEHTTVLGSKTFITAAHKGLKEALTTMALGKTTAAAHLFNGEASTPQVTSPPVRGDYPNDVAFMLAQQRYKAFLAKVGKP